MGILMPLGLGVLVLLVLPLLGILFILVLLWEPLIKVLVRLLIFMLLGILLISWNC